MTDLTSEKDRKLIRDELGENRISQYFRQMCFVLEKPAPLSVVDEDHLTDLSILKTCLLFSDVKAAALIYKLARKVVNIDFEDFITCQEDLGIIVDKLPAQQYLPILEQFGQNQFTKNVKEAIL